MPSCLYHITRINIFGGKKYPFYIDDSAFDGSERHSALQMQLMMDRGLDQGYFSKPAKLIFIAENL